MNNNNCQFVITEFSGGGQLCNYCCNSDVYVYFDNYTYLWEGMDYIKDLNKLLNIAKYNNYIEWSDFKKFTTGNLHTFYTINSLLESIDIKNNIPSFTTDWFNTLAKDNFENILLPLFKNKPVNYLEIGTFEGASIHYLFENVFNHPNSRATVIDPFHSLATHNILLSRFKKNLSKQSKFFLLIS
jgi:hypothetical protein